VIGAGPAGSAGARRASLHGLSVALVDRSTFPRDKVCGDALIPDALRALRDLGVLPTVLGVARRATAIQVYAPNGKSIQVHGESACLPRRVLDDTLRGAAVDAGARFFAPLKVIAPLTRGNRVCGARFSDLANSTNVEIQSRVTVLATGASSEVLRAFGVCQRIRPSATAARVYVHVDEDAAATYPDLVISYDDNICPGFGWLFPGPGGVFNVGVAFFYDARRLPDPANLRVLFDRFLHGFQPAARLRRVARHVSALQGAPLRTALSGATLSRPGLLVIGEAAGLTYSFSGEGIGKAMESGILAADLIASVSSGGAVAADEVAAVYARELTARFGPRFRAYKRAQDWLTSPGLGNLLAWRAHAGDFVKRQLETMLDETGSPQSLFSPLGIARALVS
jgi:geranylgeranyl reductase family protein